MWSRLAGLLFALVVAPAAQAGACCVGSTTTIPTRLGECEHVLAGIGLQGDLSTGRWTREGKVAGSSLAEQSGIATLAAGWRWDRKGQIGVTLPLWLNHKAVADQVAWGGGPGDLRVTATWDPIEERPALPGDLEPPVPVFTAGVRVPSGRSWRDATGALFEDVTGLAGPALLAGASLERITDRTPWAVGVNTELGLDEGELVPVLGAFGSVGRYFGTRWSVLGSLRHVQTFAGADPAGRTSRTTAGLRLTHGRMLAWRAWAGAEADLPVPHLGRSAMRRVSVGAGFALVR